MRILLGLFSAEDLDNIKKEQFAGEFGDRRNELVFIGMHHSTKGR